MIKNRKLFFLVITPVIVALVLTVSLFFSPNKKESPIETRCTGAYFLKYSDEGIDSTINQMTLDEKIAQLIFVKSRWKSHQLDSVQKVLSQFHIGGAVINSMSTKELLQMDNLSGNSLPLFLEISTPTDFSPLPNLSARNAIKDSLIGRFDGLRIAERIILGSNFIIHPPVMEDQDSTFPQLSDKMKEQNINRCIEHVQQYNECGILGCAIRVTPTINLELDSLHIADSIYHDFRKLSGAGLSAIITTSDINPKMLRDTLMPLSVYLHEVADYNGLLLTDLKNTDEKTVAKALLYGADMVLTDSVRAVFPIIKGLFEDNLLSENVLDYHLKRILLAKKWMCPSEDSLPILIKHYQKTKGRELLVRGLLHHSITVISNKNNILPFGDLSDKKILLVRTGVKRLPVLKTYMEYYDSIDSQVYSKPKALPNTLLHKYNCIVLTLNDVHLDSVKHHQFLESLNFLDSHNSLVILNFNHPENREILSNYKAVVQIFSNSGVQQELVAQAIFGGIATDGKILLVGKDDLISESGVSTKKTRLGFTIPEEFGMSSDTLKQINNYAMSAIYGEATPGCEILVAKEGMVIYYKSFGKHTYDSLASIVDKTDLYDLASVTKVAATTMASMYLYSRNILPLDSGIGYLFSDSLKAYSRLGAISFRDLLLHQTGLSSAMPIYKYLIYRDNYTGKFDKYFCDYDSTKYTIKVANNFFLDSAYGDSIWIDVHRSWPGEKKYKYSDLNFNLLYYYISVIAKKRMDSLLTEKIYKPLGLHHIGYLPLNHFGINHIVPTENDDYWRFQLLQGYVHDPSAALLGGVAGNAGLFSDAYDLAVLMQLVLNGGTYGGVRLFSKKTTTLFTTRQTAYHSNRGLGFNMQQPSRKGVIAYDAPMSTFGHTGFTGNCVWADPENELIYVFLSNRVYPKQTNKKLQIWGVRQHIHQVIYNALPIKKLIVEKPVL